MKRVSIKVRHILRRGPKVLLLAPLEPDDDSGFVEMTVPAGDFIEHAAGTTERPIREAGARLLALLMEHPKIALLLQSALAGRQATSIEFMVSQFAQEIPWEILWDRQSRFLGMHADRPTFRSIQVAHPATLAPREPDGILRIAAVLAAADLPSDAHWDAIYRAVRGAGFDYRILAVVSSDHLMDQILAAGDPRVQACYVPRTAWELVATIGSAKPQLLYMFCHGVPGVDDCLEIETRVQARGGIGSSVYLSAEQFLPLREQLLIAVLNSCCGAAPTADMDSLAYALVNGGVPAAVGMREKISGQAADAFCQAFFEAVSRCLGKTGLLPDGFDSAWGRVMNEARLGLCMTLHNRKMAADLRKEWTLPVLYTRPNPPRLRPPLRSVATARPDQHVAFVEHRSELEELEYQRDRVVGDIPADRRRMIEAQIVLLEKRLSELRAIATSTVPSATAADIAVATPNGPTPKDRITGGEKQSGKDGAAGTQAPEVAKDAASLPVRRRPNPVSRRGIVEEDLRREVGPPQAFRGR